VRETQNEFLFLPETTRKDLASGKIPGLIVEALRIAGDNPVDHQSRHDYTLQAARVAANLVVDDGQFESFLSSRTAIDSRYR